MMQLLFLSYSAFNRSKSVRTCAFGIYGYSVSGPRDLGTHYNIIHRCLNITFDNMQMQLKEEELSEEAP